MPQGNGRLQHAGLGRHWAACTPRYGQKTPHEHKAPHHLRKRTKYREGIKPTGSTQGNCPSRVDSQWPACALQACVGSLWVGLPMGNLGKQHKLPMGGQPRGVGSHWLPPVV